MNSMLLWHWALFTPRYIPQAPNLTLAQKSGGRIMNLLPINGYAC